MHVDDDLEHDHIFAYSAKEFPYRVEINRQHVRSANEWLDHNVPDSGDSGDQKGWMWNRSIPTPRNTRIYAFKQQEHAIQFALIWS